MRKEAYAGNPFFPYKLVFICSTYGEFIYNLVVKIFHMAY